MNKLELFQILSIFLVVTLIFNYALHSTIINQDKEIRDKAMLYVNEYCKIKSVNDDAQNYVFNPNITIDGGFANE